MSGYRVGAYGDGSGSAPTPPSPGSLVLWFDGQNMDGLNNSTLVDGGQIATWKNLGTQTGGDVTNATSSTRPLFRKVAAAGKLNGLSAGESDGTMWLQATAFGAIAQPYVTALVMRQNNIATTYIQWDGTSGSSLMATTNTGAIEYNMGALAATTNLVTANIWASIVSNINGGSSFSRLNGTQSANVSIGTNGMNGCTLFGDRAHTGGVMLPGMIAEFLVFAGTLPATTDIETYLTAKYGAFPQ